MLEQGAIIDGRYEVEKMIGEGGLAHVYKVRHKALGSVHALKLLSWRKKQLAERLLTEGRIQAQLSHPNIVSVIDIVQHEGQFGLLMEYVDNQCLEDFIVEHGGLGVEGGMELFAPILSAVAAAHEAGVTHRDLKPANVLLAAGPGGVVPKVTDFGIAKVMAELTGTSTAAGTTLGTPGYLAPEQIEDSSRIDKRADIFALGAILYELITGRQAFIEHDGTMGVMSTSRVEAPPLTTWISDVPPYLDAVLAKAMAKDPADRYPNCIAFAEALYVDHPRLKAIVNTIGGVTTTLSLSGAREELERTLERRTLDRPPAPQAATIITEPIPPPRSNHRVWLGVGLLAAGAVLVTIALAGAGAFGVKRTLGAGETPTEVEAGLPMSAPIAPSALVPVEPEPAEPAQPAPVEPDVPVRPVQPAPVVAPVPAPVEPVPSEPAPVEPAPTPVEPAPTPVEPAPAPVEPAPVEPAPAPVPEPVIVAPAPVPVPAPVEPAPAPTPPDLAGSWTGKANKRPFRLTLMQGVGGSLSGRVTFPGATTREESLQGAVDAGGSVRFDAGDLSFRGSAAAGRLQGTYTRGGGKALSWSVTRK